jgi:hypothetical protein
LQQREHSHEILDFGICRCRYAFRRCNGERTHWRTGFPGRRGACYCARSAKFRGGNQTGDGADKRPAKAGRRWGRAKRNAPTSQKGQAQTPGYVKGNRKLIFLSFVYGRDRHSISNFYAACVTLAAEPSTQLRDVHLALCTMKFFFRNSDRRAELSALVTIAIVLEIVAAAKFDAVTSLFHIAR